MNFQQNKHIIKVEAPLREAELADQLKTKLKLVGSKFIFIYPLLSDLGHRDNEACVRDVFSRP